MYRVLNSSEIKSLESRGCSAQEWASVEFKEFDASKFYNVQFYGNVKIGSQSGKIELSKGFEVDCTLRNVTLHNSVVGDNVYINSVKEYISNYHIEDNVVISSVDTIVAAKDATFGNGVRVSVLNEAGGREVVLFDKLSSQVAYLFALYRENSALISSLEKLVDRYVGEVQRRGAYIGRGSVIRNCGELRDLFIGEAACLEGVAKLVDGSINSTTAAPTYVGRGVIAEHFIILSAARVTDGVLMDKCFVGQGCELGKQFSAENSLFFSNCVAMHGEACATFAGPYTVTHHKSTLLIGGIFSFMNAGSGSNQSNHMYKFGPVHQGVVERGSKLASDSYILWPMRIGAFSLVIGKHYSNADTSMLPFSYIIEKDYGEPMIVPAANLRSVGTLRDIMKWPKRDKRGASKRLDVINFKMLNPYTVSRMMRGRDLLRGMISMGGQTTTEYVYGGCKMKRKYVERGIAFYEDGIDKFLGGALFHRLEVSQWTNIEELKAVLSTDTHIGVGQWCDISGAIVPQSEVSTIIADVQSGVIGSVQSLIAAFRTIETNYDKYVWRWVSEYLEVRMGSSISDLTFDILRNYLQRYLTAVQAIDLGIYEDARKEFSDCVRTGFGIDGAEEVQVADFEAVRGTFESNDLSSEILGHLEDRCSRVAALLDRF